MIYVGIDVASEKHDVAICNAEGENLCDVFTIPNNRLGFNTLISTIAQFSRKKDFSDTPKVGMTAMEFSDENYSLRNVKIGLESTGHYSNNILSFLSQKRLCVKVFNPLAVNFLRKSQTLRKTKTDKADAKFLARMLIGDQSKPYKESIPQIAELKTLTRHRHRLVGEISKHKIHILRLISLVFPEIKDCFSTVYGKTCVAILSEFPSAEKISNTNIVRLTNLIKSASKGYHGRTKAEEIRNLARNSIGNANRGEIFELKQHLYFLQLVNEQLAELNSEIKDILAEIRSPICSIKGLGFATASMILAEIGDVANFANAAKLLAFAGLDPSQYQSGNFNADKTPMTKRGSKFLRYALMQAAMCVSKYEPEFKSYLEKKLSENKHYYVAITHVAKKLLRVIFSLLKNNAVYELPKLGATAIDFSKKNLIA